MSNDIVKKEQGGQVIKDQSPIKMELANPDSSWAKAFAKVLPSANDVARFMACAMSQLANPKVGTKLAQCSKTSFYNSALKAARFGIMPDGVNAYLIPYGTECQLQFSYRGLCDMAIRYGIAIKFASDIVRENDMFKWTNGELVEHTPAGWDDEERGKIVGVWVRAYLNSADHVDQRMSFKEIEQVRSKSQNPDGVWAEWYEEMAKKACLKRLFKTMQNTPVLSEAIETDNASYGLNATQERAKRVSAADLLSKKSSQEEGEVVDVEPTSNKEDTDKQ